MQIGSSLWTGPYMRTFLVEMVEGHESVVVERENIQFLGDMIIFSNGADNAVKSNVIAYSSRWVRKVEELTGEDPVPHDHQEDLDDPIPER